MLLWDIAVASPLLPIMAALSSSLAIIALLSRARRRVIRPAEIVPRRNALLARGVSPRIADALARGEKIAAIKAYREEHSAGLRDAKEAIESLERAISQVVAPIRQP